MKGMALQPGTGLLWAMPEMPILGSDGKAADTSLQVMAFDPAKAAWTRASFKFALGEGATAIGDFNIIVATRAFGHRAGQWRGRPQPEMRRRPKAGLLSGAGSYKAGGID